MNQQDDPIAQLERAGSEIAQTAAKLLAQKMIELAQQRRESLRMGKLQDEDHQIDSALKESGYADNKQNRGMVKEWAKDYEDTLSQQSALKENLAEIDKRMDRIDTILELPPESQKELGFDQNSQKLKDLTTEKNSLSVQKIKLEDQQEGVGAKLKSFEQGEGLEGLGAKQQNAMSQKFGKAPKEPKPGSVFDSLVKSGYMEKGGLGFMNDQNVGIEPKPGKLSIGKR